MAQNQETICPICDAKIQSERLIGSFAYCTCGWQGPSDPKRAALHKKVRLWTKRSIWLMSLLFCAVLGRDLYNYGRLGANRFVIRVHQVLGLSSENEWRKLGILCWTHANPYCGEEAWTAVLEKKPSDVAATAGLGLAQVQSHKYASAVSNFEKVFSEGQGDVYTFAGMGDALQAQGDAAKARKWYYRALSVDPNLADVSEKLVDLLAHDKQYVEALSVIGDLTSRVPKLKAYFQPRLVQLTDLAGRESTGKSHTIRLVTLHSHHFLPIKSGNMDRATMFLVDTGATDMQVTWDFLQDHNIPYHRIGDVYASLADGRIVKGVAISLKEIAIGPWTLHNIEAVACSNCQLLAGKSVLSRFRTSTYQADGAEYLVLRR